MDPSRCIGQDGNMKFGPKLKRFIMSLQENITKFLTLVMPQLPHTIKFLNFLTPENFDVSYLKEGFIKKMQMVFRRPICPKT